jgi:Tfp pilus assembly protein PilF
MSGCDSRNDRRIHGKGAGRTCQAERLAAGALSRRLAQPADSRLVKIDKRERRVLTKSLVLRMKMNADQYQAAWDLLKEAYQYQVGGEYEVAEELYKRSLNLHPTAEAYTYLGWTYHYQGKLDEAIAECKKAIQIDPEFGNPYNDIGAYLIEKGEYEDARPWLERALQSRRYDSYHYPHYNLGRVYVAREMYAKARYHFEQALRHCPDYTAAKQALENLRLKIH